MRHLDLFSGIGGFALAADSVWPSVEHIFCDIEPFAQAILKKHWPNAPIHGDIKKLEGKGVGSVDLLTGGFPCQPYSNAGKRRGKEDDRHLWPEMFRLIREIHPRWIIGENVDGLITWDRGLVLNDILTDLESAGYEAQSFVIPATAVDAPHRRDRLWVVAHAHAHGRGHVHGESQKLTAKERQYAFSESLASGSYISDTESGRRQGRYVPKGQGRQDETASDTHRNSERLADANSLDGERSDSQKPKKRSGTRRSVGLRSSAGSGDYCKWPVEPHVGRVAHGVPARVDRIKSLGNAIVPQVATQIMRAIKIVDQQKGA